MANIILNLLFKTLVAWTAYHITLHFVKSMTPAEIGAAAIAIYFFCDSKLTFK
jgi:hypothetical protein